MNPKDNLKRVYAMELQSLPVQLVPPDPIGMEPPRRSKKALNEDPQPPAPENDPKVVNRLIDRIKRI